MRDQELRDQIAALFRCAPGEQRLGDEPPGPIADAVLGLVGPLLAEKDAEIRSLAKSWDQRLSDVQAEYVKHLESWDRSRKRLDADRGLLLWLHTEAVWLLHAERNDRQRHVISLLNDTEHAEKENDQLRRLRREVEFEAHGERWSNAIVGRPGHEYVNGYRACACGVECLTIGSWERHLLQSRIDAGNPLCACVTAEQAAALPAKFSRPVCAVHPECTCFPGQPHGYAPEPPTWNPDCPAHGDPRHLEPPSVHPGEKP